MTFLLKPLIPIVVFGLALCASLQTVLASNIIRVSDFGDGTCSVTNFQSAYKAASAGDIIQLPAGTNTWSTGITIGKGVSVIGAGPDKTKLIADSSMDTSFFTITGFTYTNLLRISGICFDLVSDTVDPRYACNCNSVELTNFRIDHCEFHHGYEQLELGGVKGVIDHNRFMNPLKGVGYTAGTIAQANASWNSMAVGTGDGLFIEDNVFIYDADYLGVGIQESIGTENGGKLVIRSNQWNAIDFASDDPVTPVMTHGSAAGGVANAYWQSGAGARRGQSTVEVYNNVMSGKRIDFMAILRGSANMVFSNILTNTVRAVPRIYLREEEYTVSQWSPNRTNWPAEDQVHNTFIWGNTFQGQCQTAANVDSGDVTGCIQENRDYWLHEPQETGGREYFSGANGASSSYPTDGKTYPTLGTMLFTNGGPNAYYGYRPYVYPHPLTEGQLSLLPLSTPPRSRPSSPELRSAVPMSCWISQLQDDSYFDTTAGLLAQSIDGSSPKVVNCVELLFSTFTDPQTVIVELRTAKNGGGSVLGSCTKTVTSRGQSKWVKFDMPNVAISNTVYVTLSSSGTARWRIGAAGGTLYGGTTYCVYVGADAVPSQDFCLKVYTP